MAKTEKLPGMESSIADLEDAAKRYADIRDQRQELTASEVLLKSDLLSLMKKHGKRDYVRDGIEIHVITESEKVKVKVRKESEAEEAA